MEEHKAIASLWRYICSKSNNLGEILPLSRKASTKSSPWQRVRLTLHVERHPCSREPPLCRFFSSFGPGIVCLFINSVTQRSPELLRIPVIDSSRCHLRVSSTQIPRPCVHTPGASLTPPREAARPLPAPRGGSPGLRPAPGRGRPPGPRAGEAPAPPYRGGGGTRSRPGGRTRTALPEGKPAGNRAMAPVSDRVRARRLPPSSREGPGAGAAAP